jgi:hypothetical protein
MFRRMSFAGIFVVILALLAACGAPGEQAAAPSSEVGQQAGSETPEQAADLMLEGWAQQAAIPYRNPRYEVLSTDGAFAEVGITAEIRESADKAWMANHAVVECRNISTNWQCVGAIDFSTVSPAITSVSTKQVAASSAITPTVAPAVMDGQGVETISEEKSLAEMLVGEWWSFEEGEGWEHQVWLFFLPDGRSLDVFTGGFCPYHVIEEEKKVSIACEDWSEEYLVLEVSDSSLELAYSDDASQILTLERIPHTNNIDIQQLDGLWRLTQQEWISNRGGEIDVSEEVLESWEGWEWVLFVVGEQTTLSLRWGTCGNELILGDTLLCSNDRRGGPMAPVLIQVQEIGDNQIRLVYLLGPVHWLLSSGEKVSGEAFTKQLVGVWGDQGDGIQFDSDGSFVSPNGEGIYRASDDGFLIMVIDDDESGSEWFESANCDFPDQNTLRMRWMGFEAETILKRQVK